MALLGDAAMLLWYDILDEAVDAHDEWHTREHFPERIEIPGFLRAQRWVAESGSPRYFVVYEVPDIGVLSAGPYMQRLNHPTEWTRRMMPYFRNMSRAVCQLVYSDGPGEGGFVATLRFDGIDPESLCVTILPRVVEYPDIVGVHLCVADEAASGIPTVEKTFRVAADRCTSSVIIIEGTSSAYVDSAAQRLAADLKASADVAIYQLENTRSNLEGAYNGAPPSFVSARSAL